MDQLDKHDPPVIPEGYVGTVALSCLVLTIDGIAGDIMPIYMAAEVSSGRGSAALSPGRPGVPPHVDVRCPERQTPPTCASVLTSLTRPPLARQPRSRTTQRRR